MQSKYSKLPFAFLFPGRILDANCAAAVWQKHDYVELYHQREYEFNGGNVVISFNYVLGGV